MHKLFYIFSILMVVIITASIAFAQVQILKPEALKPTLADLKYSATSTEAVILDEYGLTVLKAEYNQNLEITQRLDTIVILLYKIEKNTRK